MAARILGGRLRRRGHLGRPRQPVLDGNAARTGGIDRLGTTVAADRTGRKGHPERGTAAGVRRRNPKWRSRSALFPGCGSRTRPGFRDRHDFPANYRGDVPAGRNSRQFRNSSFDQSGLPKSGSPKSRSSNSGFSKSRFAERDFLRSGFHSCRVDSAGFRKCGCCGFARLSDNSRAGCNGCPIVNRSAGLRSKTVGGASCPGGGERACNGGKTPDCCFRPRPPYGPDLARRIIGECPCPNPCR
jgi:hypothetical protein